MSEDFRQVQRHKQAWSSRLWNWMMRAGVQQEHSGSAGALHFSPGTIQFHSSAQWKAVLTLKSALTSLLPCKALYKLPLYKKSCVTQVISRCISRVNLEQDRRLYTKPDKRV